MNQKLILFILFFSAICYANARSMLVEEEKEEDDSTTPVDDVKTTPTVTVPPITTPSATPTTTARPTVKPTTQVPTAPPVNDKPTLSKDPDDIVDGVTPAPTKPSQSTPNTVDKTEEKVPSITITNETTNDFINSIPKQNDTVEPPTVPPIDENTTKEETTPGKDLNTMETGKVYGVLVDEMKDKPNITNTTYGEENKKTVIHAETSGSMDIFHSIEDSVIDNLEVRFSFNDKAERRMLQGGKTVVVKSCGVTDQIVRSRVNSLSLIFDESVIFECEGGLLAHLISGSYITNVKIEFYNDNKPNVWIIQPTGPFGLLAGVTYGSIISYTRVTGDYLYIWPKTTNDKNTIRISPFISQLELTLIQNCYVDLLELVLNFNDLNSADNDDVAIGGLVGEYVVSPLSSKGEGGNDHHVPLGRLIEGEETKPEFTSTRSEIYNSFVLVRRGFSIPAMNDGQKKGKIVFGGLIGKATPNENSILFINNCYYYMIANGIVNPLDKQENMRFGGLIGVKYEDDVKLVLQLNMTYVNFIVKNNYMDMKNFGLFYGEEPKGYDIKELNNYAYLSLPFGSEDNGKLYYHYVSLYASNSTEIGKKSRLLSSSFIKVLTYGNGVQDNIPEYVKDSDVAEIKLKDNGYVLNPYTKRLMNIAPSPTNDNGFYVIENYGIPLSPEGRGTYSIKIKYNLLKDQSKMNSKKTCPNNCNKNGACLYGQCYCNSYYTGVDCSEKFCPFGMPLTNITGDYSLECSNQGKCDRKIGKCQCFPGFEGNACQRTKCPNGCSNHGICTTISEVRGIDVGTSDENDEYVLEYDKEVNDYRDNTVNVCVCDKEYEGVDCGKRKCPFGYTQTSDCEAGNVDGIKITFSKKGTSGTSLPTDKKKIYIKYIDPFKHVWYSTAFDYTDVDAWKTALGSLPTGVISISSVDKVPLDSTQAEGDFSIDISYSLWQTGRQPAIEVIGKEELKKIPKEASFYGLKNLDVLLDTSTDNVKITTEVGESLKALPCSNNGICNENTGVCKCFEMFYGNACELQTEVI